MKKIIPAILIVILLSACRQENLNLLSVSETYNDTETELIQLEIIPQPKKPEIKPEESFSQRNSQITDLSHIADLTYLRELNLSGNEITDLTPLSNLTNLEELDLNGNKITDLTPLAGLTELKVLRLANNQITDISPLENLLNLTQLNLTNNQISDLSPLKNLKQLYYIGLDNNNVEDISPLAGLKELGNVELENNKIEDISALSKLTYLRYLDISGNQITDFSPLSRIPGLTSKYIDIYIEGINLEDFWVYEKGDKSKEIENMTDEDLIEIANSILYEKGLPQINIPDFYMPDTLSRPLGSEYWIYFRDSFSSKETAETALLEHLSQPEVLGNSKPNALTKFTYLGENDYFYQFYFEFEETFVYRTGAIYGDKTRMIMFKDDFVSFAVGGSGANRMTLQNVPDKDSVSEILDMITFLSIKYSVRSVPSYIHREILETEDEYIYTLYYVSIEDMDWGIPLIACLDRREIYVNKSTGDIIKRDKAINSLEIPGTSM